MPVNRVRSCVELLRVDRLVHHRLKKCLDLFVDYGVLPSTLDKLRSAYGSSLARIALGNVFVPFAPD